ncbi:helix-turn-helix domain-containing protein [Pseudoalteromonas sp. YIC-827]|uniref:Helix-turn-helix domain-containing protein n=1 Tax=Pseudoalteromonas qingdaonensis TaxID=3131913 RepID=A0ABU9MU62_9GAMM
MPTLCFELPMSRTDTANLLGVSSEAVCREFTRLKHEGVLEVQRKKIYISDLDELYALASE